MKHVGIREFRDHATEYLAGHEPLTIERRGEPIGIYFPKGLVRPRNRKAGREAAERLEKTVQKILEETGYTEDELASLFDLSIPVEEAIDAIERRRERTGS